MIVAVHLNYYVTYTYTQYKNLKLYVQDTELTTTNSIICFYNGNLFRISELETYTYRVIIYNK